AGVVGAVLAIALVVTARKAAVTAEETVRTSLQSARTNVVSAFSARARSMRGAADVFVGNPVFRGLIGSAPSLGDVLDQSIEAAERTGADWVQITDANGVRLAKSNEQTAPQDTLSGSALIGGALSGEAKVGYGIDADSILFQAVAVPVSGTSSNNVVRSLMAVRGVDSLFADSVKSASGGVDVVFFLLKQDGAPLVAASTIGRSGALDAFLAALPKAKPMDPEAPTPAMAATEAMNAEAELGGVHYVGLGHPFYSAGGRPVGGFVAMRTRESAFGAFTDLRNTIIVAGLAGLVVAGLLAFGIARTITRPVEALVVATRKAADGDYSADIAVRSGDEIGTLADAFRQMLTDLREKQSLVEFLQAGSSPQEARTVAMNALGGTMANAVAAVGIVPGQRFANRYDIKEVLGVGGMGSVVKAVDTELDEIVALKTLKADFLAEDATALDRFKSEIRLARKIAHRNVVRNYDLGEHGGVYFITMEYAEGTSLKDLIRSRGRLPVPVALSVAKQLARALEVAHEQGVIHRDIKPANMVVQPDGVLKVMDFGIARLAKRQSGVTQAGMVVGTPEYMAPESLSGEDIDGRADIYAAGVVLYECLTGVAPFRADNPLALITQLLEAAPASIRSVNGEVSAELEQLVLRTMAKSAAVRPQSAGELHDLLERVG
ncbi:MAG: protein kinase, partial [Gemmatimonadaceae bacterium]|nr:protein kinase [Gemmatimonadaceae bacterium]